jgi:hypothetical protein
MLQEYRSAVGNEIEYDLLNCLLIESQQERSTQKILICREVPIRNCTSGKVRRHDGDVIERAASYGSKRNHDVIALHGDLLGFILCVQLRKQECTYRTLPLKYAANPSHDIAN